MVYEYCKCDDLFNQKMENTVKCFINENCRLIQNFNFTHKTNNSQLWSLER